MGFNPQPARWPAAGIAGPGPTSETWRFNPQPARWPAAADPSVGVIRVQIVSIPSRPDGRLQADRRSQDIDKHRFNPQPARWPAAG